jgi:hypothetical protein
MSIIPGETDQSFTVIYNGNYAVEVSVNGCVDTSSCVNIASMGIIQNSLSTKFTVFPNPTQGNIKVEFEENQAEISARLFSISGQLISEKISYNAKDIEFIIQEVSGIFLLILKDNTGAEAMIRIIKQ